MLICRRKGWELPESAATPESIYLNRRAYMTGSLAVLAAATGAGSAYSQGGDPTAEFFPAPRNERFKLDRDLTPENINANYNNFYEFGSSKRIAAAAQALKTRPWEIKIDGMVEKPMTILAEDLITQMRSKLEERLYRLRCVEAWSMTIPWTGFPMKALLDMAKPLSSAKYVQFQTFLDPKMAPARGRPGILALYGWPDHRGGRERSRVRRYGGLWQAASQTAWGAHPHHDAMEVWHEACEVVQPRCLHRQAAQELLGNVAAQRVRFLGQREPGSRAPSLEPRTEEVLGTGKRVPTLLFNGYGEFVADLYKGLGNERLWM